LLRSPWKQLKKEQRTGECECGYSFYKFDTDVFYQKVLMEGFQAGSRIHNFSSSDPYRVS
jgi:hypothetical protein